ncbi:MAG: GDP-mannose 4,6-dehydratase [Candidatus Saccharimonas sp.]
MTRKVVITGINGFVGDHVADTFIEDGFEILGVGHDTLPAESIRDKVLSYISCNLLIPTEITKIPLSDVDVIVHLAGLSNVGDSFNRAVTYITDNATMTYYLLEYARLQNFTGRIIIVSSGALYDPDQSLPLTELSASLENSPYAVGKLAVEHVSNYFRLRNLDTVIVRPFNHIGPGQNKGFIVPDLYIQLSEAKNQELKSITVGNLSTRRDYTDVRDIAKAYKLIALADKLDYHLYNICTGRSLAGTDILHLLQSSLGIEEIDYTIDSSKIRPTDIADIYGDSSRLRAETGWTPEISVEQTIQDFLKTAS